jgi:CRISPR-associated endonuclease/helicase Cas3
MQGPPTHFWGKLEQDEERKRVLAWHPLAHHSADVAACALALMEQTLLGERLARLAGLETLHPSQVHRLATLAALHDIGKFNIGFQNKAFEGKTTAGHVGEVAALLEAGARRDLQAPLVEALKGRQLLRWGDEAGVLGLLRASIGHHGRPAAGGNVQQTWWTPTRGLDPFAGIADLVERTRNWFPRAWEADGPALPSGPEFQHAFAGLVMLADWLGSDTKFFPYSDSLDEARFERSYRVARNALRDIGIDAGPARRVLGQHPFDFKRIWGFDEPRDIQRRIRELPVPSRASVTVLEAETGSGKTEAVLARFFQLHEAGVIDGLYFALPTRTAAIQLRRRVHAAVQAAFPEHAPPVIMAVPGYLVADDREGRRLPHFRVLWNDDEHERYRYRGWAAEHPKRYLSAPIAVGTIDQVLLSALTVGHAHMRATSLLRQLLVVDEVHASDAYMTAVLGAVLEHHAAAGGHSVLLSATLGSAARDTLLRHAGAEPEALGLNDAAACPYPSILHFEAGAGARWDADAEAGRPKGEAGRPKIVEATVEPWMDDPDRVAATALTAAVHGAKVLVIRNTVSDAIATQLALEAEARRRGTDDSSLFRCEGVATLHHSRFARPDREALDAVIEATFGKTRSSGGCVAVATQTVQQSLDLDADWMITDLCPMDVLLQRVGRLHRHDRSDRPVGFERAAATVLTPEGQSLDDLLKSDGTVDGSHGVGSVYPDLRILQATWDLLVEARTLQIPKDNRRLVERTTHPAALEALVEGRGGAWAAHAQRESGRAIAERTLGKRNSVRRAVPFTDDEVAFPQGELSEEIRTRLGEDDRRLELPTPMEGPFGREIRELTVPGWLARDVPAEPEVGCERTPDGTLRIRVGPRTFVYDRLGLRPEHTEPSEEESDG